MSVRSLCNKTATVNSKTRSGRSAMGGWTETDATKFSNMPIRVQPISGREARIYNMERTVVTNKAFVPLDGVDYSTISRDDEIVVGSTTYKVHVVRNVDEMDHHLEILLRETDPEVT